MKTKPFQTLAVEKRLAFRLLSQPQPIRKQQPSNPWLDAFCVLLTALIAGAVAWVILP